MRPRSPLSRAWAKLVHRRVALRHLALVAGALIFGAALYYTLNPHYIGIGLPSHRPAGHAPDDLNDLDFDHWRHLHQYDPGRPTTSDEWRARAEEVKQAFLHAYQGYELHAAPHDELKPLTNQSVDNFNGWGVTMYDSLDTMILMGLDDEFARALPRVQNATFALPVDIPSPDARDRPRKVYAPFFETVIRYLGGLLSAFALSRENILLERADDLGRMLSPAFDSPSGLPMFGVNTVSGSTTSGVTGVFAEVASCQLEYTYLARETGKKEHHDRSAKLMNVLKKADISLLGMFPKHFNMSSGMPIGDTLSVGAAADSGHEYFLKSYLLTAKTDRAALDIYIRTTTRILTTLLYTTPKRGLLYVTDTFHSKTTPSPSRKFEHLSCFLPGLLALGVHTLPPEAFQLPPSVLSDMDISDELSYYDLREMHILAAEGLAESCWLMYADQPSGLGPEEALMRQGITWMKELKKWREGGAHGAMPGMGPKKPQLTPGIETRDYSVRRQAHMLRPETIESIYIMWRTTGDVRWRERGYRIFRALEKEAKTPSGYAALSSVEMSGGAKKDEMPSYFLAETLKYLYLLFLEEDLVPLDKWVFNTEAHPLPIFTWSPWERTKFGIEGP